MLVNRTGFAIDTWPRVTGASKSIQQVAGKRKTAA